ncbi:MAG: nucleotide exchange factor GrpE [Oscillatoria sp. SIO1A7]|nr:nucleotide exchange factor GrpE [Oscillatoria sp. SIO1A7]
MMEEEKQVEEQNQTTDASEELGTSSQEGEEVEQRAATDDAREPTNPEAPSGANASATVEPSEAEFFDPMAIEALMLNNEALKAEQERLGSQLEEIKNQYARLGADFENYRRRTEKEKEELGMLSTAATLKELLSVVDNFERARSQIKPQTDGEKNIHKSYQSVYKQMVDSLKRLGVSAMYPKGEPFDPNFHEAVMRDATTEYPEGTVTEELMRGYIFKERVLRHAMVKVATAPEPVVTSEESASEPEEKQEESPE